MLGWIDDIEKATLDNENFRMVLFTGKHTQLTVMRLAPGEEIGWEAHDTHDQFIRLEQGSARVEFGRNENSVDETHEAGEDWAVIVPSGVWHNVVNTGDGELSSTPSIPRPSTRMAQSTAPKRRQTPPSTELGPSRRCYGLTADTAK